MVRNPVWSPEGAYRLRKFRISINITPSLSITQYTQVKRQLAQKIVSIRCRRGAVEGFVRVPSRFVLHCAFRCPGSEQKAPQGNHTETQLPQTPPKWPWVHRPYYDIIVKPIVTRQHTTAQNTDVRTPERSSAPPSCVASWRHRIMKIDLWCWQLGV